MAWSKLGRVEMSKSSVYNSLQMEMDETHTNKICLSNKIISKVHRLNRKRDFEKSAMGPRNVEKNVKI